MTESSRPTDAKARRQQRLAEALRANLRRRKASQRPQPNMPTDAARPGAGNKTREEPC